MRIALAAASLSALLLSCGKGLDAPAPRPLRAAVASNFAGTMEILARRYEASTGRIVIVVPGSTGKHYAQIRNGAPFDAFFAADTLRPRLLEDGGFAVPGSRFTYAVGRLVLWSPAPDFVDETGVVLRQGSYRHLAIASPRLAPYGLAARHTLEALGLWDSLESRIVRGENVGHAFNFVRSGNAELGFVAYSQIVGTDSVAGSAWIVPPDLYEPILQQAVLLQDTEAAHSFYAYLTSQEAHHIIRTHGYEVP